MFIAKYIDSRIEIHADAYDLKNNKVEGLKVMFCSESGYPDIDITEAFSPMELGDFEQEFLIHASCGEPEDTNDR